MSKKTTRQKKSNVDVDYNKHVRQFANDYKQIDLKKKQLESLKDMFHELELKDITTMSNSEITDLHKMKNEIDVLQNEIDKLDNLSDMTQFYLKTGGLLIDYYDSMEHIQPKTVKKYTPTTSNAPTLLNFFGSVNNNNEPVKTSTQRADIYDQYLSCVDPHHQVIVEVDKSDDFCQQCGVFRELVPNEAIMVCPKCKEQVQTLLESDKPSYQDATHDNMYYGYKRIGHFKEQLAHYQAKETTKIPQEVYDLILVEFKKEKKNNLASLTRAKVKKYLQKYSHLGYAKYYENIYQIIWHLNGIHPLTFTPALEEQLCNMFQKIQEPFEKHHLSDRKNFLSYSYVMYKFCQLLGHFEYLQYFSLLKSKDKLRQQDKVWKNICQDLGWKFYPS